MKREIMMNPGASLDVNAAAQLLDRTTTLKWQKARPGEGHPSVRGGPGWILIAPNSQLGCTVELECVHLNPKRCDPGDDTKGIRYNLTWDHGSPGNFYILSNNLHSLRSVLAALPEGARHKPA